jgi:putative glycosyltransferase
LNISIVSTIYFSKPFLEEFLIKIKLALNTLKIEDYEIIFVNDGSPDDSLSFLLDKRKNDSRLKIVDLSRNFGHHYAIQAGLKLAKGNLIFLIDNDLETDPMILIDFYNELIYSEEFDVVYGFQESRKGNFFESVSGQIFWWIINKISDTKIPYNLLTERLMTRKYLDGLLTLEDANLFLAGMMHWVGYNQKGFAVKKGMRKGSSTYTVKRRVELMIQAISSFSGKPLEWLFYFGIFISICSFLFIIYLIIMKLILDNKIEVGWSSLIAVNSLILGIISTFLGIIGIYLFKIFKQVQGRPNAIIKDLYV